MTMPPPEPPLRTTDDGQRMTDNASKVMPMREAIARFVHDGDTVVIEGFTHLICFAAGHEIIRQGRRDLTPARPPPDLIYDQMIAAGAPPAGVSVPSGCSPPATRSY